MTTPAILAGTISITLSAPARHAGGGKEALRSLDKSSILPGGYYDTAHQGVPNLVNMMTGGTPTTDRMSMRLRKSCMVPPFA